MLPRHRLTRRRAQLHRNFFIKNNRDWPTNTAIGAKRVAGGDYQILLAVNDGANGRTQKLSWSAEFIETLSPNWQNTTIESRLCNPLLVLPKTRKHKFTLAGANTVIMAH